MSSGSANPNTSPWLLPHSTRPPAEGEAAREMMRASRRGAGVCACATSRGWLPSPVVTTAEQRYTELGEAREGMCPGNDARRACKRQAGA